jgi:hypothetical protein
MLVLGRCQPPDLPFELRRDILLIQPKRAVWTVFLARERLSRDTINLAVIVQGDQVRTVAQALDAQFAKRISHGTILGRSTDAEIARNVSWLLLEFCGSAGNMTGDAPPHTFFIIPTRGNRVEVLPLGQSLCDPPRE